MTGRKYVTVRDPTTLSEQTVETTPPKKDSPYQRLSPFNPAELATETWQPIPGHESRWQVSSLGRVRNAERISKYNTPTKSYLATQLGRDGYERFISSFIDDAGKRWTINIRIHRAVAMAFLPNPKALPIVHHKDNNKLNNRLTNLEWVTPKENVAHALQVPGRIEVVKQLHKFSPKASPKVRSNS